MMDSSMSNYIVWGTLGLLFVILGGLLLQVFSTFKQK